MKIVPYPQERDLPFLFPCSEMARKMRAVIYGGAFQTALRGIPWEDVQ